MLRDLIPHECMATPSPAHLLPHLRDSVGMTVQLCGVHFARICFGAGIVDHVRPSPRHNRTGRSDLNWNSPVLQPD